MRFATTVALLWSITLQASCESETPSGTPECSEVSAHLETLCGGFAAMWARKVLHDCEALGLLPADRRCVLRAKVCDEQLADDCDLHDRTWGCSSEGTCPPGIACDLERGECVECFGDGECIDGRFCADGWCIVDSDTNRLIYGSASDTSSDAASGDAGIDAALITP